MSMMLKKMMMKKMLKYPDMNEFHQNCSDVMGKTTTCIDVIRTILIDHMLVIKTRKRSQNDDNLPARPFNSSSSVWTLSIALSLSLLFFYIDQTLMENVYLE